MAKHSLLRLAVAPANGLPAGVGERAGAQAAPAVIADEHARLPGRGAYVCEQRACRERLAARGVLQRAFRSRVTINQETLESLA